MSASPLPFFTLARDPLGRLVCTDVAGVAHVGALPVRAFPLTAPDEGLSLVSAEGRELVWIDRLADLPAETRALIEAELAVREFVPEIQRIVSVSTFATPSLWEVETDRGPTTLALKAEEDIRRLPGARGSLLITSGHGTVFRVRDLFALDRHSRRLIERFL